MSPFIISSITCQKIRKKLHYSTRALHYGIFGLAFLKQQSKTETYSALIIEKKQTNLQLIRETGTKSLGG